MSETFGETVRRLRKERGLTQVALAADLDISQSLVAALEQRSTPPRDKLITRLSDYFGVNLIPSQVTDRRDEIRSYLQALRWGLPW